MQNLSPGCSEIMRACRAQLSDGSEVVVCLFSQIQRAIEPPQAGGRT